MTEEGSPLTVYLSQLTDLLTDSMTYRRTHLVAPGIRGYINIYKLSVPKLSANLYCTRLNEHETCA